MKRKILTVLIGILMVGVVAGAIGLGVVAKNETLDSKLPSDVKTELEKTISNVKWNTDVNVIDDKIIQATLCYDKKINATYTENQCIIRTLTMNQESERTYCSVTNETTGNCETYALQDLGEFINEKMVEQSDKVLMYEYDKTVVDVPEEIQVGEKTISLK